MLMFISAIFFSLMGIFTKKCAEKGVPSTEMTLIRACGQAIIVVFPLAWILKVPLLPPKPVRLKVALRGIVGCIGFQCYFRTIQCLPLGDAITLFSIYPAFTVFLAIPFLGERLNIKKVIAVVLSTVGAVCIAQPKFLFGNSEWRKPTVSTRDCLEMGYASAFFGSFSGACVLIIIRNLGNDVHTIHLIFSWFVFTSIGSLLLYFIDEDWVFPEGEECLDMLLMILFGSAAHYTMNYAARLCHAGAGSIMRSTDVVWAYLWQITIFNVSPDILAIVGAILVFTSGMIIALSKDRVSKPGSTLLEKDKAKKGYLPITELEEVTNPSFLEDQKMVVKT